MSDINTQSVIDAVTTLKDHIFDHDSYFTYWGEVPLHIRQAFDDALPIDNQWTYDIRCYRGDMTRLELSFPCEGEQGELVARACAEEHGFYTRGLDFGQAGLYLVIDLLEVERDEDIEDAEDDTFYVPDFYDIWNTEMNYDLVHDRQLAAFNDYGADMLYGAIFERAYQAVYAACYEVDLLDEMLCHMHEAGFEMEFSYEISVHYNGPFRRVAENTQRVFDDLVNEIAHVVECEKTRKEFKALALAEYTERA